MLTLLVLVFEKAVTTNLPGSGFRFLSRCIDVALAPLALGSLALGLAKLVQLLSSES